MHSPDSVNWAVILERVKPKLTNIEDVQVPRGFEVNTLITNPNKTNPTQDEVIVLSECFIFSLMETLEKYALIIRSKYILVYGYCLMIKRIEIIKTK